MKRFNGLQKLVALSLITPVALGIASQFAKGGEVAV